MGTTDWCHQKKTMYKVFLCRFYLIPLPSFGFQVGRGPRPWQLAQLLYSQNKKNTPPASKLAVTLVRHILRCRAHFSPSCKKSVFLKITWKQTLKAYIYSKCIYFAYQLTYLKFWMHLDTFQAKFGWLDQQKFPFFSRLAASRQSSW